MLKFIFKGSFQSGCPHPLNYIVQDIRVDGDHKLYDWKIQWCSLCGAFRSTVVKFSLRGAVVIYYTNWRLPKNSR